MQRHQRPRWTRIHVTGSAGGTVHRPAGHTHAHRGTAVLRLPSHGLHWPVACWVFVLSAIGVVQIVRAQWFDATVFLLAAAFVTADGCGMLTAATARVHLQLRWTAGTAATAALVLCFLPRHSPGMQAIVIGIGIAAVAAGWAGAAVAHPGRQTGLGPGIRRLAYSWAVIVVIGCLWELAQFILGRIEPTAAWFSLSDLLNPLVSTVPGRIVMIAAWMAGGVWLLRRGGRR